MKRLNLRLLAQSILGLMLVAQTASAAEPKKLLVVTTTMGFRHSSIATAERVLAQLAKQSGAFTVDYAPQPANKPNAPKNPAKDASPEDLQKFHDEATKYKSAEEAWETQLKESLSKLTPENLKNYDGVVFANTTGNLPLPDKQGFLDWIAEGHAFIGMHAASDTFDGDHGWPPYIQMLGGEFQTHNAQVGVECLVQDTNHPATKYLGESYCIEQEEVYLIKNYDPAKVHELLILDKHPNNKKQSGHFPVAWTKEHGKGKVFYTTLGHREDVWENERYKKHILGGIKWALGLESDDGKPLAKAE